MVGETGWRAGDSGNDVAPIISTNPKSFPTQPILCIFTKVATSRCPIRFFKEAFVLPILRIPPELMGNGFSRPEMEYNPSIEASSYWCSDTEVRDCISGVSWTTRCPGGEA